MCIRDRLRYTATPTPTTRTAMTAATSRSIRRRRPGLMVTARAYATLLSELGQPAALCASAGAPPRVRRRGRRRRAGAASASTDAAPCGAACGATGGVAVEALLVRV